MILCIICRHSDALKSDPPPVRPTDLLLAIGAGLGVVLLSETPAGRGLRARLCLTHTRDMQQVVDTFVDDYITEGKEATS